MVLLSRKYGFYKEVPLLAGLEEEQNVSTNKENSVVKHTVKDSVFTNLFKEKKYLVQLYQALHPEGSVTEDDIKEVTVSNVLVDDIYNDIGFIVGSTLLVLVECQATWTVNIIFRALMYLVQTYREYFRKTKQNLYKSKKLEIPEPELYVIYTGNRKTRPEEISLKEEFFDGKDICIDVKVKMIYDGRDGDIISQYIEFTKVCNGQIKVYGRTRKAIQEAVRICKDKNVLKEYLESREQEVVDMMMELYDEQEILKTYVESERFEAENATKKRMAMEMLQENEPINKIIRYSGLSEETVLKLKREQLQTM